MARGEKAKRTRSQAAAARKLRAAQRKYEAARDAADDAKYHRDLALVEARAVELPISRAAEITNLWGTYASLPRPSSENRERFARDARRVYIEAGKPDRAEAVAQRILKTP